MRVHHWFGVVASITLVATMVDTSNVMPREAKITISTCALPNITDSVSYVNFWLAIVRSKAACRPMLHPWQKQTHCSSPRSVADIQLSPNASTAGRKATPMNTSRENAITLETDGAHCAGFPGPWLWI